MAYGYVIKILLICISYGLNDVNKVLVIKTYFLNLITTTQFNFKLD